MRYYVDFVPCDGVAGRLGLTHCPGLDGDLDSDLTALRDEYRTDILVTLLESHSLARRGLADLATRARGLGIVTHHFPIVDGGVPVDRAGFDDLVRTLLDALRAGRTVVVHCLAGLGRSGTLAACLLVRTGLAPPAAIARVRQSRRRAIETPAQVAFVETYRPGR